MLLLKADVTANTDEHKALLKRFGLFGPPGILFFDAARAKEREGPARGGLHEGGAVRDRAGPGALSGPGFSTIPPFPLRFKPFMFSGIVAAVGRIEHVAALADGVRITKSTPTASTSPT